MSSVLDRDALEQSPLADLHLIANELGVDGFRRLRKPELIDAIIARQSGVEPPAPVEEEEQEEAAAPKQRGRSRAAGKPEAEAEVEVEAEAEVETEVEVETEEEG